MKYKVIKMNDPDDLEEILNAHGKSGWELDCFSEEDSIVLSKGVHGLDMEVMQHSHCNECGFVVNAGEECPICVEFKEDEESLEHSVACNRQCSNLRCKHKEWHEKTEDCDYKMCGYVKGTHECREPKEDGSKWMK